MASIKVKFRPSTVIDREGTIYYQVIHERKVRQLLTSYHVFPSEWDEKRSMVTTSQKSERKSFMKIASLVWSAGTVRVWDGMA